MIDHARLLKFHSIDYNPDKKRFEIALEYNDPKKNALQFVPLTNNDLTELMRIPLKIIQDKPYSP